MASYFSSITSSSAISNLGTRLNSLRRAITSDETDDPENEDCSHISNVLRAYYTEKGRPFPGWLPPDPKAPVPTPSRMVAATTQLPGGNGGYGQTAPASSYGRGGSGGGGGGGGGGLGDLWGDSAASTQPPASQTSSLRQGRGGAGGASAARGPLMAMHSAPAGPVPPSSSSSPSSSQTPPPAATTTTTTMHHPRPLPSQRAGSYQSSQAVQQQSRFGQERAGSAQERLRARLQGARSASPSSASAP
ncbi:hypothetical protein ASPZODRAFT_32351, partial [Penicilliopsis zonata CBS 506.65]